MRKNKPNALKRTLWIVYLSPFTLNGGGKKNNEKIRPSKYIFISAREINFQLINLINAGRDKYTGSGEFLNKEYTHIYYNDDNNTWTRTPFSDRYDENQLKRLFVFIFFFNYYQNANLICSIKSFENGRPLFRNHFSRLSFRRQLRRARQTPLCIVVISRPKVFSTKRAINILSPGAPVRATAIGRVCRLEIIIPFDGDGRIRRVGHRFRTVRATTTMHTIEYKNKFRKRAATALWRKRFDRAGEKFSLPISS